MGRKKGSLNRKIRLDGAIRIAKISAALRVNPYLSNRALAEVLNMREGSIGAYAARVRKRLGAPPPDGARTLALLRLHLQEALRLLALLCIDKAEEVAQLDEPQAAC